MPLLESSTKNTMHVIVSYTHADIITNYYGRVAFHNYKARVQQHISKFLSVPVNSFVRNIFSRSMWV